MIKILYLLFFLFSMIFSKDCISNWYSYIHDFEKHIYKITFDLHLNSNQQEKNYRLSELYLDLIEKKMRLDFDNQVQIYDSEKSATLFNKTNQLYIENPDTSIFNITNLFFSIDSLSYNKIENGYSVNTFNFDDFKLFFKESCIEIDSIYISDNNLNISVNNVFIDFIDKKSDYNPFIIEGNYFKFDLRTND